MELLNGHTTHPDAQWYPEAELGLFVHWGISAVHGNVDISWGMCKDFKYSPELITPEEYFALAKDFNPRKYDPEKWVKAAVDAGFRYMVLTTRHHDSFALWPSRYGDFNTKNYMGGRDLVGEYIAACRKYGIRIGLYYSPPDWRTVKEYMAFDNLGSVKHPIPQVLQDYTRAIVRGQVTELLSNYGYIDLIWFDGPGLNFISREEIYAMQPHIVIGRGHDTDFRTIETELPTEQDYHEKFEGYWWECCHEWNKAWGYTKDEEYKSVQEIAGWFKLINGYHGNLLINVAPNKDGELPEVAYQRMAEFGRWLKEYRNNR